MDKKARVYRWYVVGDTDANETIARELSKIGEGEERAVVSFTDRDGKTHSGWNVDFAFVKRIRQGAKAFNFKIEVFVKQGGGAIRKIDLSMFKQRKSVHVEKTLKDLARIKAGKA